MDKIDQAFAHIRRADFLPKREKVYAGFDEPIPIGYGQTNSQPSTVAAMLRWLDVQPGQQVLDVGSGSGWTTAILAYMVGPKGQVTAVEIVPELVEFGRENCARADIRNVTFVYAEQELGWAEGAPYDRILVSASADSLPRELLSQLRTPGKIVVPVAGVIHEVTYTRSREVLTIEHPGYVFVPLL